jgi:hypothetical protein
MAYLYPGFPFMGEETKKGIHPHIFSEEFVYIYIQIKKFNDKKKNLEAAYSLKKLAIGLEQSDCWSNV